MRWRTWLQALMVSGVLLNLVACSSSMGGVGSGTPTATIARSTPAPTSTPGSGPVPTATPGGFPPTITPVSATPTPSIRFVGSPTTLTQTCDTSFTILSAFTVTIDNTGSNRSLNWNVVINQTIGTSGQVWSTAVPTSGTVVAGGTASLVVTPRNNICQLSQNIVPDATYYVNVNYAPPSYALAASRMLNAPRITPSCAYCFSTADTVRSPIPG
jgi:hypothetical protein